MKKILQSLIVPAALALSVAIAAESQETTPPRAEVLQPVRQFVANMNAGNLETAFTACGEDMSILDNVPPFAWQGKDACQRWADALNANSATQGISDLIFELGEPAVLHADLERAYAVLPARYTFQQNGSADVGKGTLTVALRNTTSGWQMTAFSFAEQ